MRRGRLVMCVSMVGLVVPLLATGSTAQRALAAGGGSTRSVSSSGTVVFTPTATGSDTYQSPEIRSPEASGSGQPFTGTVNNRSRSNGEGQGGSGGDGGAGPTTKLGTSFNGLYHRQQRLANGGNQFSVEPPDQGLCVGGGKVLETVNDVTRVYDSGGNPLTGVEDLNSFFGYAAAIDRTNHVFGPFVTDPSCLYDSDTQRWFMTVLTLDTNPKNGHFTGGNHLDTAVSQTSDPAGAWTIYKLAVQDDGTGGTPDHGCSATADTNGNPTGHGPCFGDYPHIGADHRGFFITTNEYSFFGPEFHGAQIYAFSKRALAQGASSVLVTQFDTNGLVDGNSGFTLWPATTSAGSGGDGGGGSNTEYFMSSNAADEAHGNGVAVGPRSSTQLLVWAVANTESDDSDHSGLSLSHTVLDVNLYGVPPASNQKVGSTPLADCLNLNACATVLLGAPDPYAEKEYKLDSNDTRMQQVTFANGELWGALDTALTVNHANKAGIEWFIVKPHLDGGQVGAELVKQGYLGLKNNNLNYPAIGVLPSGKGVMGFTVVGNTHFPSAGYAAIDDQNGVGAVHIAAEGAGPADGFSGYLAFGNPPGTSRPRWGDYGAAVPDGDSIWIASEYIGQTCDLTLFQGTSTSPFGSCNGTRSTLANWYTRISKVSVE